MQVIYHSIMEEMKDFDKDLIILEEKDRANDKIKIIIPDFDNVTFVSVIDDMVIYKSHTFRVKADDVPKIIGSNVLDKSNPSKPVIAYLGCEGYAITITDEHETNFIIKCDKIISFNAEGIQMQRLDRPTYKMLITVDGVEELEIVDISDVDLSKLMNQPEDENEEPYTINYVKNGKVYVIDNAEFVKDNDCYVAVCKAHLEKETLS